MKAFLKLIRPCLMLDLSSRIVVLRSASRLFRKATINNYSWFGSTSGHSCHREWKDFRVFFALELRETYLVLQLKPEIWEKWEPCLLLQGLPVTPLTYLTTYMSE